MKTIVDELVTRFSADTSQLEKAQKKIESNKKRSSTTEKKQNKESIDLNRKFAREYAKNAEEIAKAQKKESAGLGAIAGGLKTVGGAVAGAFAVKQVYDFMKATAYSGQQLINTAKLLGENTKEMDGYGKAIEIAGGSAGALYSTLERIGRHKTGLSTGQSQMLDPGLQLVANAVGMSPTEFNKKPSDVLMSISSKLRELSKTKGFANVANIGEQGGIDKGLMSFLLSSDMEKMLAQGMKSARSEEDLKKQEDAAKEMTEAMKSLEVSFQKAATKAMPALTTAIDGLAVGVNVIADFLGGAKAKPSPTVRGDYESYGVAAGLNSLPSVKQNPNAVRLAKKLQLRGFDAETAQAIAGNLMAESGGLATATNPTSKAYGLGQWLGGRKTKGFQEFAKSRGLSMHSVVGASEDLQLDYLKWELDNKEKAAKMKMAAAKGVGAKAAIFAKEFERPYAGGFNPNDPQHVLDMERRKRFAASAGSLKYTYEGVQPASKTITSSNTTHIGTISVTTQGPADGNQIAADISRAVQNKGLVTQADSGAY